MANRYKKRTAQRAKASKKLQRTINVAPEVIPPYSKDKKPMEEILMDRVTQVVEDSIQFDEEALKASLGSNLKTYMSSQEMKNFTWILLTVGYGSLYRTGVGSNGNMTKEEHRNLKMGITYFRKYILSVLGRVDESEMQKIMRRTASSSIRIFDRENVDRLTRAIDDAMETVALDRDEYNSLCYRIMTQTCRNCDLSKHQCELCQIFEETSTPESGWNLPGCPYAYEDKNSPVRVNKFISSLETIRDERQNMAESAPTPEFRAEFEEDVKALDKALELLVESKGKVTN